MSAAWLNRAMSDWGQRLSANERAVLRALLGAAAALSLDEVSARARAGHVHDELTALLAHGLVAHSPDGWGLTPLGRDVAIALE